MRKELNEVSQRELRLLKNTFGSKSRVASFLGVNRSRLSHWGPKESPHKDNQFKINSLYYIVTRLLQVYQPPTIEKWLFGINTHLANQRPIDLVVNDRIAEVLAAIEQADTGAYA